MHCDLPMSLFPGLYLKSSSASSSTERACSDSKAMGDADEFALAADCKGIGQPDIIKCIVLAAAIGLDFSL